MIDPTPIEQLTAAETEAEMRLRDHLDSLADLITDDIAYVSRQPDTRELRIRRDDGEIIQVDAAIVDAYLESRGT